MITEVLVRAGESPRMPQADYGQCSHLKLWHDGHRGKVRQFRCSVCGKRYREGQKPHHDKRVQIGHGLLRGLSERAIARRVGCSRQAVRYVRDLLRTCATVVNS